MAMVDADSETLQALIADQSQDDQTDRITPEHGKIRNETDTRVFHPHFRMSAIRTRRLRPDVRLICVGVLGPWSAIEHAAARIEVPSHLADLVDLLEPAPCPACQGGPLGSRRGERLAGYCLACDRCGDQRLAESDWANRKSEQVLDPECPRSYLNWALRRRKA